MCSLTLLLLIIAFSSTRFPRLANNKYFINIYPSSEIGFILYRRLKLFSFKKINSVRYRFCNIVLFILWSEFIWMRYRDEVKSLGASVGMRYRLQIRKASASVISLLFVTASFGIVGIALLFLFRICRNLGSRAVGICDGGGARLPLATFQRPTVSL